MSAPHSLLLLQIIQHLRHYSEPVFQVRGLSGSRLRRCCAPRRISLLQLGHMQCYAAFTPVLPLNCRPLQRYIVRIIFMIPVYSLASFPSLLAPDNAIYWLTVRDWWVGLGAMVAAGSVWGG